MLKIILDIKLSGKIDGIKTAERINKSSKIPISEILKIGSFASEERTIICPNIIPNINL